MPQSGKRGGPSYLCTAVYHPAARVRLMATSTGIISATASLLAMAVRRIPLPACGTKENSHWRNKYRSKISSAWTEGKPPRQPFSSLAPAAADYLVSVETNMELTWIPQFCIFRGSLKHNRVCAVYDKESSSLMQYERNTLGKKYIWLYCSKIPSDTWSYILLNDTEVWASLKDSSCFGNDTNRLSEKCTLLSLDVFTPSSFPKLCLLKDRYSQDMVPPLKSLPLSEIQEMSENTKTWQTRRRGRQG